MNNLTEIEDKSDKNRIVFLYTYICIYTSKIHKIKDVFMISHFWHASGFES